MNKSRWCKLKLQWFTKNAERNFLLIWPFCYSFFLTRSLYPGISTQVFLPIPVFNSWNWTWNPPLETGTPKVDNQAPEASHFLLSPLQARTLGYCCLEPFCRQAPIGSNLIVERPWRISIGSKLLARRKMRCNCFRGNPGIGFRWRISWCCPCSRSFRGMRCWAIGWVRCSEQEKWGWLGVI